MPVLCDHAIFDFPPGVKHWYAPGKAAQNARVRRIGLGEAIRCLAIMCLALACRLTGRVPGPAPMHGRPTRGQPFQDGTPGRISRSPFLGDRSSHS